MEVEEIDGELLAAIEAAEYSQAEDSLHAFVRLAWPQVESTPFVDNWHVKLYCDELEAVLDGRTENLLWNSPPGTGKSVIEAVFFPAYAWGPARKPTTRFLFIAYGQELSTRDSVACRKLIQSAWYQRRWGVRVLDGKGRKGDDWPGSEGVQLTDDQNQKIRFDNTAGGWRIATSVGGRGTGEHPDIIIGGDLHKADHYDKPGELAKAIKFWDSTVGTRGVVRGSRRVVSGQRLAQNDITGHLEKQGDYVKIAIAMEHDPELMPGPTPIGGVDPRTAPGELMWPEVYTPKKVEQLKRSLRNRAAAQLGQKPKGDAGVVFGRPRFRYLEERPTEAKLPPGYPQCMIALTREDGRVDVYSPADVFWFQVSDTAIKTGKLNDYTATGTYGITPANDLLVWDVYRDKIEVPDQFNTLVAQRARFPFVAEQNVEDAASGSGLIQEGRKRGVVIRAIKAFRDKVDNAQHVASMYADHQVFHRPNQPWLEEFEDELIAFPTGDHDDMVDTLSNAGRRVLERSLQRHGVYAPADDEKLPTMAELLGDMMPKDA